MNIQAAVTRERGVGSSIEEAGLASPGLSGVLVEVVATIPRLVGFHRAGKSLSDELIGFHDFADIAHGVRGFDQRQDRQAGSVAAARR